MSEGKNIYEEGAVSDVEKNRLQTLEYPVAVSEEVLGENLKSKSILDLGSGPNTELGEYSKEHNANYIALDVNEIFLQEQKKEDVEAVRGSVEQLPFRDNSVDISHMRFVLMHLPEERRKDVIEEALRVARERALFLEYDWETTRGGDVVSRFRLLAISFMKDRGIEPFMGKELKSEIELAVSPNNKITEWRFHRNPGNYYNEIIPLAQSMKSFAEKEKDEELVRSIDEIISQLEDEARKERPEEFTRPDIVVVAVEK